MDRSAAINTVLTSLSDDQAAKLVSLDQEVEKIHSFAHEYDFYPGIKANGFRSFAKIIDSYFGCLVTHKNNAFYFRELIEMIPAMMRQVDIMKIAREKKYEDRTSFTVDDEKILQNILAFPSKEIEPFFGPLEMFYLPAMLGQMYAKFMCIPAIPMLSMDEKLKFFSDEPDNWTVMRDSKVRSWSSKKKGVTKESEAMSFKFATMLFGDMMPQNQGVEQKEIRLPLLTEWKIQNPGNILEKEAQKYPVKLLDERKSPTERTVDAIHITPIGHDGKPRNTDDCLIIHYHGGGFVYCHPRDHSSYLKIWSKTLGVPVLSPNYRKAPENKFPAGLQDCLDTFLFVTSGRPEVKELLGFHPKKVLLTGDSAGGNLAASVTIALNEIRRNNGKNVIKMPTAIVAQYPYSDPSLIMTPSEALSPLTPVIGPRPLTSLMLAYPPTGILSPRDDWFERGEEISTWARILSPSFKEPLINNLAYTHFDELSDVPLYVHVCEFDPLLDEGLILAKKWSAVKVDLIADIHGWCLFGQEVTHKDKFDLIISRMAEALEIRKT